MQKKYYYSKTASGVYRPFIKIYFLHPLNSKENLEYDGLIDSGATYSIFPARYITLLGHNLEKGTVFTCHIANKKVKSYLHKVEVKIDKWDEKFIWKIYFSKDIDEWNFGILGYEPFFRQFKITFNYSQKIFILEKI